MNTIKKILIKAPDLMATVTSQAGWSAINFIVVMLVARYLSIEEFAIFAIYLAIKRGLIMAAGALVLVPLTVISSNNSSSENRSFGERIINVCIIVLLLLLILEIPVTYILDYPIQEISVFIMGGVLVEIHRRILYIEAKVLSDVFGVVVNFIAILSCIIWLYSIDELTLYRIMLIMGAVNIAWVVLSRVKSWGSLSVLKASELREMWTIGAWGLASNLVTYAYTQVNTLYTFLIIGQVGVAVLEMARQFVAVLQPLLFGMANYFQPLLANSAQRDNKYKFSKKIVELTIVQVLFGGLILFLVMLMLPYILELIVPDKMDQYQGSLPVAYILALAALFQIGWQQPGFAFVALGKPMYGFSAKIISTLIAVPLGYLLTMHYGVIGAALTKLVGDCLIMAVSIYMLYKLIKSK